MTTHSLAAALSHFEKTDPQLFALHGRLSPNQSIPDLQNQPVESFFNNLSESIVSQQLSTKVADVIWARLKAILPEQNVTPGGILHLSDTQLKSVGLSRAKQKYLKNLAETVKNKTLKLETLPALSNEEVISQLTIVKGIGRWTAEMFLMFTLGRPDIFSFGDLGLRNAIKRWYQVETLTDQEKLAVKWQPYRTYAARILWKSLTLPN